MNLKYSIEEAINAIGQTTTLFYQHKTQEGYEQFNQTLNVLMQAINLILVAKSQGISIDIDEQKLNTVLGNAMAAMEQGDTILISDILIFELKEMFEDCLDKL